MNDYENNDDKSEGKKSSPKNTIADITGVGLIFVSIVIFFSSISSENGAISAEIANIFGEIGSFIVALMGLLVGMWLLIRHFD